MRIHLLLILLIYLSCIDPPAFDAINTQDPNNEYYLAPPSEITIASYDDHALIVLFTQTIGVDSVKIDRFSSEDSTQYTVTIDDSSFYVIDSTGIELDKTYQYSLNFINEFGASFNGVSSDYYHQFLGVDSFNIQQLNEREVQLNWRYCFEDHFTKEIDYINWQINKEIFNASGPIASVIIDTILSLESDCNYFIIDTVELGDSILYSIQVKSPYNLSQEVFSSSLNIDFPNLESFQWIPINSNSIKINWNLENLNAEYIQTVTLTNNLSGENYIYETYNELSGAYIDNLSQYTNVVAGQSILYNITWCGVGNVCKDTSFVATTLPFYHMEYVPRLYQVEYGTDDDMIILDSTEAFYIDLYEVSDDLYNEPGSNPEYLWSSYPKDSVNFYDARIFCNNRTEAMNNQFGDGSLLDDSYSDPYTDLNYNQSSAGFHLANEVEWEVAASIHYDLVNGNILNKFIYPMPVGTGELNCVYANYLGCYNGTTPVGYFDGENYSNQDAPSPTGLYDVSGNIQEWVEKYFAHTDTREILRGGDFLTEENNCKTTSYIYENANTSHKTIGFRTAISANPFLEKWYEWIESE